MLAADRFTVADLIMTDVLRVSKVRAYGDRPATEAYIERVTARPAFQKAHSDHHGQKKAVKPQITGRAAYTR